jgi:hypothetical protein
VTKKCDDIRSYNDEIRNSFTHLNCRQATAAFGGARLRFVTEDATCWDMSFAKPARPATANNAGLESKCSAAQPLNYNERTNFIPTTVYPETRVIY